jgi:hypothetical protein
MCIGLLATILQAQGNLDSETKELYERSLVIHIRNFGSENFNTTILNFNMGIFYHLRAKESQTVETRKDNLQLSEPKYKESLRIFNVVLGPNHPKTIKALSQLSIISRKLSKT